MENYMKLKKLSAVLIVITLFLFGFQNIGDIIHIGNVYYSSGKIQIYFTDKTHIVDQTLPSVTINDSPLSDVSFSQLNRDQNVPITILFLVDVKKNNYSVETNRASEIIEAFLDTEDFGAVRKKTFFVRPFGDQIEAAYDPRGNAKTFEFVSESSDYFAALQSGIDFMLERQKKNLQESQSIVLITDGATFSEKNISMLNLKNSLKEAGIPVYAIIHNDRDQVTLAKNYEQLTEIIDETNGFTQRSRDVSNVKASETIIAEILKNYVLYGDIPKEIDINQQDEYKLNLIFETNNSVTAETIKPVVKINGLYEDVIAYREKVAKETMSSQTQEAENQKTFIVTTKPPDIQQHPEAVLPTIQNESNNSYQFLPQSWNEFLNKKTNIFNYEISNTVLAGTLAAIFLIIVILLIVRNGKKKKGQKPEGWMQELSEIPESIESINNYLPNQNEQVLSAKTSCNISFENVDKRISVAPLREFLKNGEEKTFGRNTAEGVIGLNGDESISKVHFKLSLINNTVYIEDMASSNGVILNGNRIQARTRIHDNDLLLVGRTTYRIHLNKSKVSDIDEDDKTQIYF